MGLYIRSPHRFEIEQTDLENFIRFTYSDSMKDKRKHYIIKYNESPMGDTIKLYEEISDDYTQEYFLVKEIGAISDINKYIKFNEKDDFNTDYTVRLLTYDGLLNSKFESEIKELNRQLQVVDDEIEYLDRIKDRLKKEKTKKKTKYFHKGCLNEYK